MFANSHHLSGQMILPIADRTFRRVRMQLPPLIDGGTVCQVPTENVSQRYSDQLANLKPPKSARILRIPFPFLRVQFSYSTNAKIVENIDRVTP